jgi:hypothetical protein
LVLIDTNVALNLHLHVQKKRWIIVQFNNWSRNCHINDLFIGHVFIWSRNSSDLIVTEQIIDLAKLKGSDVHCIIFFASFLCANDLQSFIFITLLNDFKWNCTCMKEARLWRQKFVHVWRLTLTHKMNFRYHVLHTYSTKIFPYICAKILSNQ